MKKRYLTMLACLLTVGAAISALTASNETPLQRHERVLAERRANPTPALTQPTKAPVMAGDKQLYGWVNEAYDGALYGFYGPAKVNSAPSASDQVKYLGKVIKNGVYYDGKYLAVSVTDSNESVWTIYDAQSWSQISEITYTSNSEYVLPYALTWDPVTGNIYGCFYQHAATYMNNDDAAFCVVNLDDITTPTTVLGDLAVRMQSIAADADGVIWGLAEDGNMYNINKLNGTKTLKGAVDLPGNGSFFNWFTATDAAVIDWEGGDMYVAYADEYWDTFVAKVNLETLQAQLVANYSYEYGGGTENTELFTGLWFYQQPAAAATGTPAAATAFTAVPAGTSQDVDFTFTAPSLDTDGQDLAGALTYTVFDGTNTVGTGTCQPGEEVNARFAVVGEGQFSFSLTIALGDNVSVPVTAQAYVGEDTPVIPTTPITQRSADKRSVVIYMPEVTAQNGGNLGDLSFAIKLLPEGAVLTEAESGESYTYTPDSPYFTPVSFELTPKAGSKTGEAKQTRQGVVGDRCPVPFHEDFSNNVLFNEFLQVDGNKDGNCWWWHSTFNAAASSIANGGNDDYMLVGPFYLDPANLYTFSFKADGHNMNEVIAAYITQNTSEPAEITKNVLVQPTIVNPMEGAKVLTGEYTPQTAGAYYMAIRSMSTVGANVYVFNVDVTALTPECPDVCTDLSLQATAASNTISGKLPSTTLNGSPASLTALKVLRNGELMETITQGIADGASFSWTDNSPASGKNGYQFVAVNANGDGRRAEISGWGGLDIPSSPTDFKVVEDLNTPGLIHLSWTAPQTGVHGGFIDPAGISYHIEYSSVLVGVGSAEPGKTTEFDYQLPVDGKQGIVSFSVWGSNAAGEQRETWNTKGCYYGPALPLPLRESWENLSQHSGMWSGQSLVEFPGLFESYWDINDGSITRKDSQDHDGGMLLCSTTVAGRGQRVRSPRVDLGDAVHPTFTFYYLYTPDIKDYWVEVAVDDQPFTLIETLDTDQARAGQWIRKEISLEPYKGCKYLQLGICATASKAAEEFAAIDNVSIADVIKGDLAVESFKAPAKGFINDPLQFTLSVRNNTGEPVAAGAYTVKLYKNETEVCAVPGCALPLDGTGNVDLFDTPAVTDPAQCTYRAEIVYEADENTDNNVSQNAQVRIVTPEYPGVKTLAAESADGVHLTWDDPDPADMPDTPVTETFENYEAFSITPFGDWKLNDGDGNPTVIMAVSVLGVLDYPHIGEPMSWQVFDPDAAGIFFSAWYARSGKQFLFSPQACQNNARDVHSNDWLISPRLNGKSQTISFYATAAMSSYSEEMAIMYSTETDAVADFKVLQDDVAIPYEPDGWTEFSFKLPEGTRYFALVHKSFGGLGILLDDLTYTPAGSAALDLQLQGFHVYRNGTRINEQTVTENEYWDKDVNVGDTHTYHVTALWDKGESPLSEPVTIQVSGLDGVGITDITISPRRQSIAIDGAVGQTVYVFDINGNVIAHRQLVDSVLIPVPVPGVYVVKVQDKVVKLLVK